jgi:hypothetical protein
MALNPVVSGTDQSGKAATRILSELQGLTFKVTTGAAADADIAVTGLKFTAAQIAAGTADTIVAVVNLTDLTDGPALSELQAGSAAGTFQFSTTSTAAKKLLVIYYVKPT